MSIFDTLDSLPDDPLALREALQKARQEYTTVCTERDGLREQLSKSPGQAAQGAASTSNRNKTVVAIDDSKVMQMRYRSLMTTFGWEVVGVAENGASGAEMVLSKRPRVVLLDYEMPVMNGIQTLAVIRQVDKDVKVIVVSGSLTSELLQALMRHGANEVLVKPISEEKLKEVLDHC